MSAISYQAGLHRLDIVAEAGRGDQDAHVGHFRYVDFALPGADRLQQDEVLAGSVERVDHAHRRGRQLRRGSLGLRATA